MRGDLKLHEVPTVHKIHYFKRRVELNKNIAKQRSTTPTTFKLSKKDNNWTNR
jgi:hypothetical protein